MAISKTQGERPAIIALIDSVNADESAIASLSQNVNTLTEGLADEITDREAADSSLEDDLESETNARVSAINTLTDSLGATNEQVLALTESLGATNAQVLTLNGDVDALETAQTNMSAFINRFRVGVTESFTIATGSTQTANVTFNTPYAEDAQICVFLCCVGEEEIFTNLECQLMSATYSGFRYSVNNSDAVESHTIAVGFLAVQVN